MFHIFSSTTSRVVVSYWVWGLEGEAGKFVVINISDVIYFFYSRRSRKSSRESSKNVYRKSKLGWVCLSSLSYKSKHIL